MERLRRLAFAALSVFVFGLALWAMHRTVGQLDMAAVGAAARSHSGWTLAGAMAFALASYGVLCGFDGLGLRYIGRRLPVLSVVQISFVSHAISHNAGFAFLSGGSVRLRMYRVFGLGGAEVATVMAFAGLSFALGVAALASAAFILEAGRIAPLLRLPPASVAWVGWAVAGGLALYLLWTAIARRRLAIGAWVLAPPGLALAVGQVVVASLDLVLVAAALHLLLPIGPATPSFLAFIGIYVVSTVAGTISHVPGGLGVFEGALLLLLPGLPAEALLAALVIFRVCYNLVPLILAAGLLAVFELRRRRPPAWVAPLAAPAAGILGFVGATVALLAGAAAPPVQAPSWLAEPAHLLAAAAAAVLLLASWGVATGGRAGWRTALAATCCGLAASLGRGPDWIATAAFALPALGLLAAAPLLRADQPPRPPPWGWIGAGASVVAAATWIGWLSGTAPWHLLDFTPGDLAARAMRGNAVALAALLAAGLARQLRAARG
ncbi:lysylphosphatidylglycerol synthase domain-containing protein [Magnetospirillum sp. UT-4]|uniref:lysylphosphatidylglycerol synthase domain-containing protein n=1 Tax=Magnetospirillum sp. UT-4 TaxID=2681467 RepID=UPI0015722FFF|nr:lysylphosphatidylglycerol synthase domain-containing protein [Magnetospirillum sp. UT-4]